MILDLLLGGGFGLGLWALWNALRPHRPTLAEKLAHGDRGPVLPAASPVSAPFVGERDGDGTAGWAHRLGRPMAPLLAAAGLPGRRLAGDLRALDVPVERHLAEMAAAAAVGLTAPLLAGLALAANGRSLGWLVPVWAALLMGVGGLFVPGVDVRHRAAVLRADARYALSLFLGTAVIALSGGAGVQQALAQAAEAGHGQAFAEFRHAITEAQITHTAPWGPLGRLGQRWGIGELDELASAIQLAGSEGAKVTASLTVKAESLRAHLLADSEAKAGAATEQMSLPVALLFAAFLVFVCYPAITNAMNRL
ncbi:type II secretion system F family protein [Streptacidiphilus albus]|uniref:type II secretion system F family protein n=1 Tax=Streptacidiphilus albus TaxID=105425 RepID=UPI00054B1352|nr:type II secretion system F family protein [Streptacidiphilus albus]